MSKEISASCSSGSKAGRCTAWSVSEITSLADKQLASGFELESPHSTKHQYTNISAGSIDVLRIFAASPTAWLCKTMFKPFQLTSTSKSTSILSQVYLRPLFSHFQITMESHIPVNGLAFKKSQSSYSNLFYSVMK